MSLRSRITGAAIVAGLILSVGLITPTVATAAPITFTEDFALHFRSGDTMCVQDLYEFGREGSGCDLVGNFDGGHPWTPSGTARDFLNVGGSASYDWYSNGLGEYWNGVSLRADNGAYIVGRIPSRSSDQFTVTYFYSPSFGTLAYPGQKLKLNVRAHKDWYGPGGYYDFYLAGDLVVQGSVDPCPPAPPFPLPSPIPGPIWPCSATPTTPNAPLFGSSG